MDIKFKELLDNEYSWPDYYQFKFIIKIEKKDELLKLLEVTDYQENLSKNGNYTSITYRKLIKNSDEVMDIYERAKSIEGVMSL